MHENNEDGFAVFGGPPEDEIIPRWASRVSTKIRKFDEYLEMGTIGHSEACVIALNGYKTSLSPYDHQWTPKHIPLIVKVLFGYGENKIYRKQNRFRCGYKYRSSFENAPTDLFFRETSSAISASIFSHSGFLHWHDPVPSSLSENLLLIHNPFAGRPLERDWLKRGQEIWISEGFLHKRNWTSRKEHALEILELPFDVPDEIKSKL